jgi:hypothetical protein
MIAEIGATRRPGQLGGKARQKREDMGKKKIFCKTNKQNDKKSNSPEIRA